LCRSMDEDAVDGHFGSGQLLAEAVVQFASEATALVVLHGDQAAGKAAQLHVEDFELASLAVEFRENTYLRAQQFGNDGDRNVVDTAALVPLHAVHVRQVDGRNENDSGLLKTGMLANHVRELEAVDIGHAHIHQHDSDVVLQQALERFGGSAGFDEILAEFAENGFKAQQLGGLVVHHQDVDLFPNQLRFPGNQRAVSGFESFLQVDLPVQPNAQRPEQLLGVHGFGQIFGCARL